MGLHCLENHILKDLKHILKDIWYDYLVMLESLFTVLTKWSFTYIDIFIMY